MLDLPLRPVKDRVLAPVVRRLAPVIPPVALTVLSLLVGLAAAAAAAVGAVVASLLLWWLARLADGLDGPVARARGTASDSGGYADILGDTVVYAAIPIGVAVGVDEIAAWAAVAVLVATFYVNAVSWTYLAAIIEKRGAVRRGEGATSVVMPSGVIEGTETIVLFTVLLADPGRAVLWSSVMAALVALTVVQRAVWACRHLP